MKKVSLTKKILLFATIPFLVLSIFCSCLFLNEKKNLNSNQAHAGSQAQTSYVDSEIYMSDLNEKYIPLERAYSLDDYYPFFAENQTNSNLCWVYSSMKVLETSLMKQRNEYHNFSDVGTALLYYLNYTSQESDYNFAEDYRFINIDGMFSDFNMVTQNYGLIYENAFSNDLYYDLDKENYENYLYVLDHVDNKIMDNVRPINIHDSFTYTTAGENKVTLLKKYIKTYGGIFTGLEMGIINCMNNTYHQQNTRPDNEDDGFIASSHAVCIVGWDDEKSAFRALNSWGVGYGKYNYFWIPYNYNFLYGTTYGYVCTDALSSNNDIVDLNSSAGGTDGFGYSFMNSNTYTMKNLFAYGEDLSLSYKFSSRFDFQKIFVNIYKNQSNVNSDFNIEFDDNNRIVTITTDHISKLNDGYYVEFYYDQEFVATKDFYVFTGSEVCYVEFLSTSLDTSLSGGSSLVLFNNNFASGDYTQTYYHNEFTDVDYYLNFYFPYNYTNIEMAVSDIFVTSTDSSGDVKRELLDEESQLRVTLLGEQPLKRNLRTISIKQLFFNYRNKMVEINIDVMSKITGNVETYKFFIFVSEKVNTTTASTHKIVYEVDGGINDDRNIDRYPNYDFDKSITAFELFEPTKDGSIFRGWYLDKAFTKRIDIIDGNIPTLLEKQYNPVSDVYYSNLLKKLYSDDIVIYAWWESEEAEYFNISLDISSVKTYEGDDREIDYSNLEFIYGDSIISSFVFSPIADDLKTYSYFTSYTYKFNGEDIAVNKSLSSGGQTVLINNDFLTEDDEVFLVCGDYKIEIFVTMIVSHQFIIYKDVSISYSIAQKVITANFDESSMNFEYDGRYHKPRVSSFNGTYPEDGEIVYKFNNDDKFLVGNYEYTIESINNNNYVIVEPQTTILYIYKKTITVEWIVTQKIYNGVEQVPDYKLNGVISADEGYVKLSFGMTSNLSIVPQMVDVGIYGISIKDISNDNYQIVTNRSCMFEIVPAKLTLKFDNKSVGFTIPPIIRQQIYDYRITWTIEGDLFDREEELNIEYSCKGPDSTESGQYPIIGSYDNKNYDIEIINGIYTVLGEYCVYYTLPDGTEYKEVVKEGEKPKGVEHIDESIFKVPFMSKVIYDKELVGNGKTDLYIKVTTKSYSWVLYISIAIFGFVGAYFLVSRKERRNRYR